MRRYATPLAATMALFCLAVGASSASAAAPPKISLTAFSEVTTDSVTLKAMIDPQGKATSYRFEYGPSDCSSNPCTSVPGPTISGVSPPTPVTAEIEGLTPGGSYHFRVVAKNVEGEVKGPDTAFTTYVLEQGFGFCPNDSFRSGPSAPLPDCRAYEQASPLDKNGADVNGETDEVQAASTGGAVTFFSAAGLPGGVGAQDFETYLARRGEGSWSTQGVYPPASAGPVARNAGWTPDLSQFFSNAAGSFLGPWIFRSRSSADSTFTSIAANTAVRSFLAGASADGSKVYFQNEGQLLPNAVPGKDNLYAWDRDTETVSLAGILPDSACATPPCVPPGGSFAGPYTWLSGEGIAGHGNSSYYIQDEHAISADGSKAYFTSAGQIYLRKNATSLGATTVHVSASQKTNGPGGGPDVAGTRPAAFMAAATDGSVALFTSPEKLTNDATTGPEPSLPTIARANVGDGSGKDLGFLPAHANGVAVGGEHIYWANPDAGTIGRAKLNGSGPPTEEEEEFIAGVGSPQYVTLGGEYIYWTNAADGQDGHGTIGRAKIGATEAEEVKPEFIKGASNPQGIAVNAEHIYWGNDGSTKATTQIMRAGLNGSGSEEFGLNGEGNPGHWKAVGVAIDANYIYFTRNGDGVGCIERIGLANPGEFVGMDCDGNTIDEGGVYGGIAIDGSHIYWANSERSPIGRSNLNGGEEDRNFITAAGHPQGLALDGSRLYWSANQKTLPNPGNDLYRFDAGTGDLTDLTVDPSDENGADVLGVLGTSDDGSHVYFVANGDLDGPGSPGNCKAGYNGVALGGNGSCNLYLSHAGATTFIARLDASTDVTDWAPLSTGVNATENTARVSADGQTLLFLSRGQFYRYHLGDPLVCVSCNPTGAPSTGVNTLQSIGPSLSVILPPGSPAIRTRNLSADGNQVFFESSEKLVAADVNGEDGCPRVGQSTAPSCQDVYEWEAEGSGSCESSAQNGGCLYLLSGGTSPEPSFFADASASGEDAFIFSRESLVPQDKDRILDVYDVRAGGGLASQHQPPPFACEAEGCKAAPGTPPSTQSPGTSSFTGPGNQAGPKPKPRCPKGKRRARSHGKSRCVAKHQRHRDRNHRDTNPTRKASR